MCSFSTRKILQVKRLINSTHVITEVKSSELIGNSNGIFVMVRVQAKRSTKLENNT
ncbi:expressed protein [Dictyostelium purpureum]|uniref:Expressed protein n=1 Tax=Dictyostelium purpureum TaxID=5786 RepID=F0ZC02_DICPU|nr:uncharacterized protein DICPUDRAFT_93814 [Dictyostelium purpureum]EGC38548.1 expressed protein [Dictyostelium purpureum]|eukprot:XP_003284919.1 expressed protein [Dictyostelium purpureum]